MTTASDDVFDLGQFATDSKKETEGVWFEFKGGVMLKIARYGTDAYFAELEKLRKPYLSALPKRQDLPPEIAEEIYDRSLARMILKDWQGLKLNGKDITYSEETAFRVLHAPALKPFRAFVIERANMLERFALEQFDELEKNLLAS